MKFATVTLNPAIDLTATVRHFTLDAVNRGESMQMDAGGKGVNVASFLADYGCEVAATGFLGRENAEIFERLFARKQIEDRFVRVAGANRVGIKIVDPANQTTTDLNLPGLAPSEEDAQALVEKIEQMAATGEFGWFILSGRPAQGLPDDFYAGLIGRLKRAGVRTALDTSQEALRRGAAAGPDLIKPNLEELRTLVGWEPVGEAGIQQAARGLQEQGIGCVVVSMGARGALLVDRGETWLAVPPRVRVASTVGAGDAMLAGLALGLSQGLDPADCARLATAFAVSAVTRIGAHLPARAELDEYARQVTLRRVQ